jgi:hypothetical protein
MSVTRSEPGFSNDERALLAGVLDEIIPPSPDGKFPGAGALGLASSIEQALRHTPEAGSVIVHGLTVLDEHARRHNPEGFAALADQDKLQVLSELLSADQAFFMTLIFHAYVGYYQQDRVLEALGLEPRPPHPKGYEMQATDFSLLEPVRRRSRLYRECGDPMPSAGGTFDPGKPHPSTGSG